MYINTQPFARPRPILSVNMDTVERAVRFAITELKVETLKDKQKEAICSFVKGAFTNDVTLTICMYDSP